VTSWCPFGPIYIQSVCCLGKIAQCEGKGKGKLRCFFVSEFSLRWRCFTTCSELQKVLFLVPSICISCLCMKYIGEPLNGFALISYEDVFGPSLGSLKLKVKVTRDYNGIFRPLRRPPCSLLGVPSSFFVLACWNSSPEGKGKTSDRLFCIGKLIYFEMNVLSGLALFLNPCVICSFKTKFCFPSHPVDIIWATIIVWRIREEIIRIVLCCFVYDSFARWYAYTITHV